MEELYLYCIRERTEGAPAISTKGIDGKGEVFVFPYRELEAIVSNPSEEFASEEIQQKAQEDMNWIKEKAIAHEEVIETAMKEDGNVLSLIPMRFGTIFRDRASLEAALSKDYSTIKELLERVQGKQEWSVKVYLRDKKVFEQRIKETNQKIKEKEKEIASLPEGMAFFMEEELKEAISKEANRELNNIVDDLFEDTKRHAVESIKCKILEKALTGRQEPMVLNAAYLIPEGEIEDFKKEVQDLNQAMQAKGFYLEYSGPWPAYNFTSY